MTLEADITCLRQLPLFQAMPPSRLKLVALMSEKLHFEAGGQIIEEGERSEGVYVILRGEVEFSHRNSDGRSRRLHKESGAIIGDVSILTGQKFVGSVSAKSEVTALRLPKDLFLELLETVPDFSLALCRDLAMRVHRLADILLHEDLVYS